MPVWIHVAGTGVSAVLLHGRRSVASVFVVVVLTVPYLVGVALAEGLRWQAELAIDQGADLYLSATRAGSPVHLPQQTLDELRDLAGVTRLTPRLVGRVFLGKDQHEAVLVGMPWEAFTGSPAGLEGQLPAVGHGNQLVLGSYLAEVLQVRVGSVIPPFYRSRQGDRVSQVVGVFAADSAPWQAHVVLTDLESAQRILDCPGQVSDLLVECPAEYITPLRRAAEQRLEPPLAQAGLQLRVVTRPQLLAVLPRRLMGLEGLFTIHWLVAISVGLAVTAAALGIGQRERSREVAILKAQGWQTEQVLLRAFTESLVLALLAGSVAVLLAHLWLVPGNGWGIAWLFLVDVPWRAPFRLPVGLTFLPVCLAYMLALVVIMVGSIYVTWRAAIASPATYLR